MDNNDYVKYIEKLIPTTFSNIFVIDLLSDLVMDYVFEKESYILKSTIPFTTFLSELERIIHPDDIKGYVDSITYNDNVSKNDTIRYEYRQKLDSDEYGWYSNTIKYLECNQNKLTLVLVEDINENIEIKQDDDLSPETLLKKQKIIFDVVSNAIINLNNVVNINYASNNPEVKSISNYMNNILIDLTNTFPELNDALTANMIQNTNQGKEKVILIIDDDKMTCNLLAKTFEEFYKIIIANDGQEAIDILEKNSDIKNLDEKDKIVGMFLDLNMPIVDGFGVLDYMSSKNLLSKLPVIIISGDYDQYTRDRAYLYPIADILEKPFNVQVIKHRIRTLVKLYKSNNLLNEIVLNQHQEIKNVLKTIVKSYLYDCANDVKRVSSYMNVLARQVSDDYQEYNFEQDRLNKLTEAVKYYNIGLYVLPHKMFEKQNFTDDEEKIIKRHPFIGLSIFNSVLYHNTDGVFNHFAKDIIRACNENYDGTGYPKGIKGDDIPIVAQIAAVAIEYNKLLKVMNESSVFEEIKKNSNIKFNPKVVNSLMRCVEDIKKINSLM